MDAGDKRRLAYLDAMGIQAWSLRLASPWLEGAEENGADLPVEDELNPDTAEITKPTHESANVGWAKRSVPIGSGQDVGWAKRSVPIGSGQDYHSRNGAMPATGSDRGQEPAPTNPGPENSGNNLAPTTACGWDELQAKVANCVACPLHLTRTQTVFGVGDRTAGWMVIGEAPGEQEDLQGEPFVGRAGLLLNEMLRAIGLGREQVFIANILKCRPPKNRDPEPEEASACEGFLKQQLALVKPKIILAVGRIAAQNLLKTTTAIGKLRGSVHDYQGVPVVVTYHPAYLLRSPLEKRRAFEDLRLALQTYRQTR